MRDIPAVGVAYNEGEMLMFPLFLFATAVSAQTSVDYVKQVAPLLRAKCYGCHGPSQQISGLRLDQRRTAMAGGYSGTAIVPGKSAESRLIQRVSGGKGVAIMPPAGKPLTADEVAVLRNWIDQGAIWPEEPAAVTSGPKKTSHWAFQPVVNPAPPASGNPVDAFVRARLAKEGLSPAPEAAPRTLLRRVYLDLTGLPPTPPQIAEFLADRRPDAYERLVERLLASPHFGERWARPWLDRARYADSDGYEKDWERPYAWRYRQWVIDALNRDMGFDQFTVEQLAGDLLPGASVEQKVATGFHRQTMTNREGGVDNKQFRFEATVDRVNTTASTWLGLTMHCTQCHDHKYDPLTQKDFYQLYAFFDNVEELDIDAPVPGELGPYLAMRDECRAKRDALLREYKVEELQRSWEKEILDAGDNPGRRTDWDLAWSVLITLTEGGDGEKILRIPEERRSQRQKDILTDHFVKNYHFAVGQKPYAEVKFKELDTKLRELKQSHPQLTQAMTLSEEPMAKPSHLRVKGDYRALGIEVKPGTPGMLPPMDATKASRLDLARWLVAKENPLTARVTVNWIWNEIFGRGLVKSIDDFGTRGDKPTHPELLDYLAYNFRENNWSLKWLLRTVVTSATYRQSSKWRPELQERDPENALLARQSRLRMPAEWIRDAALTASGLISLDVGGKSVKPPQPAGVTELSYGSRGWGVGWGEAQGPDKYRRGLYIHFQRSTPYPMLMNFDAPKANVVQCKRERSNTPLQALNLLNDPVFQEAAQALAYQAMSGSTDWGRRLDAAFVRVLGRSPEPGETLKFEQFFTKQKALTPEERDAWSALASVLLNLDEFVTKE